MDMSDNEQQQQEVDISFLTSDERESILKVLARDEYVRKKEEDRITQLRQEIRNLRAMKFAQFSVDAKKECARCQGEFGWLMNRAKVCHKCNQNVCSKCRQALNSGRYICILCLNIRELERMSGSWFYSKYPSNKKSRSSSQVISAVGLLRASLDDVGSTLLGREETSNVDPAGAGSPQSIERAATTTTTTTTTQADQPVYLKLTGKSYEPKTSYSNSKDSLVERSGGGGGLSYHGMMMEMMEKRNDSNDHSGLWRDSELEERERSCPDGDDNDDVVGRGGGDDPNSRFIVDPDATSELEYGSLGPLKRDKKQKSLTNLVDSLSNSLESLMSVYSGAGEVHYGKIIVRGEVQISCLYNETSTKLDVTVHQCKGLAVVNFKKKTSNPYIKCYLLPDKSRLSKRKSNIKKGTLHPIFDTIFHYKVPAGTIEQRSLELSVWHADKQGRNDFLGECVVQLNSQQLVNIGQPVWFKLKNRKGLPSSPLTYYGDVDVSLKFLSRESLESHVIRSSGRGELQVLVKQARNLSTDKSSNLNGSFCKATLMHRDKKKILKEKSDLVRPIRNTCVWNQTFLFKDVSRMELMQACLELTFWDKDKNSNDFLGGVRLNTGQVGREPQLNWMDGRGEEVLMWQSMIDRPDSWIDGTLMLRSTMTSRK